MKLTEETLQKIEDYLDNKMIGDTLKNFELEIQNDEELLKMVFLNQKMRANYDENNWSFLKDSEENREVDVLEGYFKSDEIKNAKKIIQKVNNEFNVNTKLLNRKSKYYAYSAVAASILIIIGYFIFSQRSLSAQELYSEYNNWGDIPSLTSRSESINSLLTNGEQAFLNKNYDKAENYFNMYLQNNKDINANALVYLGIAQLELNKYDYSLNTFDQLINSNNIDNSKGYWYKTLVYLKMNNKNKAIYQLKTILKYPENFNYLKAKKLLTKLQE